MEKNKFKVKKITKKKIILEEEQKKKKKFILFIERYGLIIYLLLLTVSVSTFMVSSLSVIKNSGNYEESGLSLSLEFSNGNEISLMNAVPITDEYANTLFTELYGNSINKNTYIILVDRGTVGTSTIYYFSDGTCIVSTSDIIYKVSSLSNGDYGISINNNEITYLAKKISISIDENKTLADNSILTFYTDGSVMIDNGNIIALLKDSDNLVYNQNGNIDYLLPCIITYINSNSTNLEIVKTINTDNNMIINYYIDGSAVIEYNDSFIKVDKGKDIIIENNKILEISNNRDVNKIYEKTLSNIKIQYFDDGSALVEYSNDDKKYVSDSDNIIIGDDDVTINGGYTNIKSINTLSNDIKIINLENNLSIVVNIDGSMYILSTEDLLFDSLGNIKEISNADTSNDLAFLNFTINNNIEKEVKYRLVVEEDVNGLSAEYIKYRMVIGNNEVNSTFLDYGSNVWENSNKNYILYEGTLGNSESIDVNLGVWVDYDTITSEYQDKNFIGTIKLYAWTS